MDNDVVVTTATKVRQFQSDPGLLTVRLGDWDPKIFGPNSKEDFPHVTKRVVCIRIHPRFDSKSLAYNIAVIKLEDEVIPPTTSEEKSVADVVIIRTAPRRPANRPGGVQGSNRNPTVSLRQNGQRVDENLEKRRRLLMDLSNEVDSESETFIPRSYINTACLPENQSQFVAGTKCWVAAWGNNLREQREVDISLVQRRHCERVLKVEFEKRGVTSWDGLSSSELCAGGEAGKDACEGEGGAPLVCLDQATDQFYAVGMVNYGFGCGEDGIPAVYVNLADPEIKSFIIKSFGSGFC